MAAILEKIFLALYPDMFTRLKTTIEPSFMLFTKIEQWFHPSAALLGHLSVNKQFQQLIVKGGYAHSKMHIFHFSLIDLDL